MSAKHTLFIGGNIKNVFLTNGSFIFLIDAFGNTDIQCLLVILSYHLKEVLRVNQKTNIQ